MRWIYFAIAAVLLLVFLRADVQLSDIIFNANLKFAAAALLFLAGILAGQIVTGHKPQSNTWRIAGWGLFVAVILGLLEYSVEWQRKTLIANNQTVILSAASVESVNQHFIAAKDGLFVTPATFNSAPADALIDTGASLVLLNYKTAVAAGIDVDALDFSTPVTTASGPLKIAEVTLDTVRVGDSIVAQNVKAAVTPEGSEHSNLLGASFLNQLDEAVLRNSKMILRQKK